MVAISMSHRCALIIDVLVLLLVLRSHSWKSKTGPAKLQIIDGAPFSPLCSSVSV